MKSFAVVLLAVTSVSAAPAGSLRRGNSGIESLVSGTGIADAFQGGIDMASGAVGDAINVPLDALGVAARANAPLQDFEKEEEAEDAAAGISTRDLEDFEKEEEAEDAAAGISTRDLEDFEKEEEAEDAAAGISTRDLEDFEKEEEAEDAAAGISTRAEAEEEACVNEED